MYTNNNEPTKLAIRDDNPVLKEVSPAAGAVHGTDHHEHVVAGEQFGSADDHHHQTGAEHGTR